MPTIRLFPQLPETAVIVEDDVTERLGKKIAVLFTGKFFFEVTFYVRDSMRSCCY
jgi:hypothetical protein